VTHALKHIRTYLLVCSVACATQPLEVFARPTPHASKKNVQQPLKERDEQHDFDFEIGTWKTHLRRLRHPLSGSTSWVEYEGTSVVRKVWNGRANLVELKVDGPAGHIEGLSLRLYDPESHQWSLNFANTSSGTVGQPTIGEFKNGRGEFYDQESFNGRVILVRNVFSEITPTSCRFEQAFSDDGGKTWEVNWIATDTRVKDESDGSAGVASAREESAPSGIGRQSLNDAWWTGPMLAASAATLLRGHSLIEPYLYDVIGAHSNGFGSLTYVLYGLTDKLTVGAIPTGGFNKVSDGPSSSSIQRGDIPLQAQYRLTQFHVGSWIPATALNVQESFPTGRYDQLGDRPSDGFGSGAHTTTLGLYSQMYFWLPNQRILRMRFDTSQAFSSNVNVEGVSVYGTAAGFSGQAKPGNSFLADPSWEYSLTRSWVLALDTTYRHNSNTRVTGDNLPAPSGMQDLSSVRLNSGSSEVFAFAPALEYNWRPNLGVLLGLRVIPASHNTNASITPAVAINFVH
jgi:hypothetical protein